MCLLVLAYKVVPGCRLVVAANRDEFHERPTAPAAYWPEAPRVFAGRDLRAGGTWMGVTRTGRFAALTNYRDMSPKREGAPSRGTLVARFLTGVEPAEAFVTRLFAEGNEYDGFNLLAADRHGLYWVSNRGGEPRELEPGICGLSNHLLDTAWPKVTRTRAAFERLLADTRPPRPEELLSLLADRRQAEDDLLPHTGLDLNVERLLSAPFIVSPAYGTRTSTAFVLTGRAASFTETTFGVKGEPIGTVHEDLDIPDD